MDGVLVIRTQDRRMVGADESTGPEVENVMHKFEFGCCKLLDHLEYNGSNSNLKFVYDIDS